MQVGHNGRNCIIIILNNAAVTKMNKTKQPFVSEGALAIFK